MSTATQKAIEALTTLIGDLEDIDPEYLKAKLLGIHSLLRTDQPTVSALVEAGGCDAAIPSRHRFYR